MVTLMDTRDDYGEARWLAIGWIQTMLGVDIDSGERVVLSWSEVSPQNNLF